MREAAVLRVQQRHEEHEKEKKEKKRERDQYALKEQMKVISVLAQLQLCLALSHVPANE